MEKLVQKLEFIKERREEVGKMIVDPDIVSDMKKYILLTKEYKDLELIVAEYDKLKILINNINVNKDVIYNEKDEEFVELAKSELKELDIEKDKKLEEIKILLLPKNEEDSKNAVVEIRAGTGGDEAGIFVGDLYRMYEKYCNKKNWSTSLVDSNYGTNGGFKEVVFEVSGEGVYGILKYEGGVHRVQRVPVTETQGRVHTSAVTVAIMPEAEEFDVEVKESDLRVDSFCSSGPGGQSVNTTYSAIRLTHLPTGIVAQCQDQKSKLKNYDKALTVLKSRIYEMELKKKDEQNQELRRSMVSTGDRSAKIRTYNYPQSRVTDHRINLTLYDLENVLNGDLDKILDPLKIVDNTEKLKAGGL